LLQNNQISGSIPESIGKLVKLIQLNLSENYFFDWNFVIGRNWEMENYNKPNPRKKSAMKIVTTGACQPFD